MNEEIRIIRALVDNIPQDGEYGSCSYCFKNKPNTFDFPAIDDHTPGCPYRQAAKYLQTCEWTKETIDIYTRGNWKLVRTTHWSRTIYVFHNGIYQTWRANFSTAKKYTYENGPLDNPPAIGQR